MGKWRGNPYLTTNDHGTVSEKRVMKKVGAVATPASGALLGCKSDGVLDGHPDYSFRVEAKSTVNGSLSLKYDWLLKIAHEARETNRIPALTVSFVTGSGECRKDGDWAMIPMRILKELLGELQ